MKREMLFIRKRAADVRPGQKVRCKSAKGRWGWWTVASVESGETKLFRRTGASVRVSANVILLLPISADPNLC